jgi:hypothetical protein
MRFTPSAAAGRTPGAGVEPGELFDIHAGREKTLRKFPPRSAAKAPSNLHVGGGKTLPAGVSKTSIKLRLCEAF